jgi:chromosome partitioning protein
LQGADTVTGKIITITQQKGGSGKTTLAAHLAVAAARLHGKTVAIVDTDPQGSLGRWFMARAERSNGAEPDMGFRTASAWGARYEAQSLAKDYDIVIIDTPPKMGVDGRPAIETADVVLIPVSPSPVDLWATEPTLEMAGKDMGATAARTMIGNRVIFASSMGNGSSVLEAQSKGLAAQEISDVAKEVLKSAA